MQTKQMQAVIPFEIKQIEEDKSGDFFRFKGLASTFGNVDFGGDIVQPGAFDGTIANLKANARPIPGLPGEFKLLPILWQHNMREPLGSFTSLRTVPQGLEVEGVMPKADTFVSGRVIPQMHAGSVGEMSIGYIAKQTSRDGEGNRLLEEIMLFETSLVTIAMNPKALVNEMKGPQDFHDLPLAGRDHSWDPEAAQKRIQELTETTNETISPDYKNGFLFVDPDAADELEGYQFQITDVVDEKMTVIPRALFAAAARVKSLRSGDNLPRGARSKLIDTLDQYFEKIGLESPFLERNCLRVDDLSVLDERTLEKSLKAGVIFPGQMAKVIVKAVKSSMREADEDVKREADQKAGDDVLAKLKSINTNFN